MTIAGLCFGPTITSVTYNGVAMTSLTGGPACFGPTGWAIQTFRLVAPTLGANNVVVVFTGATGAVSEWFAAAGVSSVVPNTTVQNAPGGCSATLPTPQIDFTCNWPALPSNANNVNVSTVAIQNASVGGSVGNIRVGAGETIFEIMQLLTSRMENAHSSADGTNTVMTWIADFTGGANVNTLFGGLAFGVQGGPETPDGLVCIQTRPVTGAGC